MQLEDLLNDCAVIRTTFETLAVFPGDAELREQLMRIVTDSRGNLCRRLGECRSLAADPARLPFDRDEFKHTVVRIATQGLLRRMFDAMMTVDVFEAIRQAEDSEGAEPAERMYRYELRPEHSLERIGHLAPAEFTARVFADLQATAADEANYASWFAFDRHVFQKLIATLFAIYASADPSFYRGEDG